MSREMKDSGYEWLGCIPNDWKLQKGKYLFSQKNDRGNTVELQLLSPTQNYGVIPQSLYEELSGFNAVKLNERVDLSQLKTVHKGAYVISLRSFQGGFEYSGYEGVVSPAYQVFYPVVNIDDRYYKYFFKTQAFIDKMNSYTMSLRDGKNIAFKDFGDTYILYPSIFEQHLIADFLESKCSKIDEISKKIQEEVDTLEEYRRSIITEAVTKGLDPDVEMKDSGIEWTGEIPMNWDAIPFQYVLKERSEKNNPVKTDERLALSIGKGVTTYAEKTTNLDRYKDDVSGYKLAHQGDLVMNSMNMIVGATGISNYYGCVSPAYYTFYDEEDDHIVAKWCEYLFLTPLLMGEFHKLGKGIMFIERGEGRVNTCRLKVSRYDLGKIILPIPSLAEMRRIVRFLNEKNVQIDSAIEAKRQQLSTLEEYKKSLIYEYVTGKKEVAYA